MSKTWLIKLSLNKLFKNSWMSWQCTITNLKSKNNCLFRSRMRLNNWVIRMKSINNYWLILSHHSRILIISRILRYSINFKNCKTSFESFKRQVLSFRMISKMSVNFHKSWMKLSWKKINRFKKLKQLLNYNI